jgi:hypothetical protein
MAATMHAVDSRFFVADDGRIVFRTWQRFVYIPEPDLERVRRRNMWANVIGFAAVAFSNLGYPRQYWHAWWGLVGVAIWVAAYFEVGRWARERYGDATSPAMEKDIRLALRRAGRGPNPSYEIAMGLIALVLMGINLVSGAPRPASTALLLGFVGNLFGAYRGVCQRQEAADEAV